MTKEKKKRKEKATKFPLLAARTTKETSCIILNLDRISLPSILTQKQSFPYRVTISITQVAK